MRKRKSFSKAAVSFISTALILCFVVLAFFANGQGDIITDFLGFNSFDSEQDFVRILDVGQGDSILIYSNGYSALIDTATEEYGGDICEELALCGINRLDVLALTHLDSDHSGGVNSIVANYKISNLILPELSVESEGITKAELAINAVTQCGGQIYTAVQGMNFTVGEFTVTVLAAFDKMASENNRSVIVMAEIDGKKFLLTGDMESEAEVALLKENLDLSCDVLKVAHHGSSSSSTEAFLAVASPKFAAISVGANSYGHPTEKVLARLSNVGAEILRTDQSGNITFNVSNGEITVTCEKE